MKIMAAGHEADSWQPCSMQKLRDVGLADAVDFAARELLNHDLIGITENGREWTRLWYELSLKRVSGSDGPIEITESSAEKLISAAQASAHAHDLMMEVIRSRLENGAALPISLGVLVNEQLEGTRKLTRPKQTDRTDPKVWARNFMLNYVAGLLATFFDLDIERGKETMAIAASDVLFYALERNGAPLNLGTIQNILFHEEHEKAPENQLAKDVRVIRSLILEAVLDDFPS
ncbi:hypothetical protein [Tropicimonas sp. IMCC6043]|uniref:hypothetical protein n=1 Tax=Tropicimonas sp. IMCC6043 TaxID=2510645 RepID=UPI00101BA2C0|nr:hypothetical protein [Tropicimonas sp. IMCC6043]RYH06039.1 hypothetical protein EU800_25185 [Tropicimonas sp. IMCC6043]